MSDDNLVTFTMKMLGNDRRKLKALQANLELEHGRMSFAGIIRLAISRLASARGVLLV